MLPVPFPEHRPSPVGGGALMETSRQGPVLESRLPLLRPLARLRRDNKASCVCLEEYGSWRDCRMKLPQVYA